MSDDLLYCTTDELSNIEKFSPLDSPINAGGIERAFCPVAHAAVRSDHLHGNPSTCPYLRTRKCGLTNYDHLCLFHVPGDPLWATIRRSIQLEPADAQPITPGKGLQ